MNGGVTAVSRGSAITQVKLAQSTLLVESTTRMTDRLNKSDSSVSGKIIIEINGDSGKKQEFSFSALIAAPTEFTFIPDGNNLLAFDNVTRASNAIVYLNTGEEICWTPPSACSRMSSPPSGAASRDAAEPLPLLGCRAMFLSMFRICLVSALQSKIHLR